MTPLLKSGCLLAFISLLAACAKEPPAAANPASPPTSQPAPETVVAVGPQAPSGQPSDYEFVMNARKGIKIATADSTDEQIGWAEINSLQLPVDAMGCAIQTNVPAHCHMVVNQNQETGAFEPDRQLLIIKLSNTYTLTIVTPKKPDEAIVCIGLTIKNAQTIEGTCAVTGDPDPNGELNHSFSASIERVGNRKIRVKFAYRHGAFDSAQNAIHNGDGHATEL